jgi:hypothetical protein
VEFFSWLFNADLFSICGIQPCVIIFADLFSSIRNTAQGRNGRLLGAGGLVLVHLLLRLRLHLDRMKEDSEFVGGQSVHRITEEMKKTTY